jgi:hypothetical protein
MERSATVRMNEAEKAKRRGTEGAEGKSREKKSRRKAAEKRRAT